MKELIQACTAELNDNLPYVSHPARTFSLIAEDIKKDFQIGTDCGLVSTAKLIAATMLLGFVVVPLGVAGKLSK